MIFRGRALSSATHLASYINWPTATPALSKLQATRVRESPPLMYLAVFLTEQESPPDYEIGLVIGATETPSIGKTAGGAIDLNSSLALGAEYDRRLLGVACRREGQLPHIYWGVVDSILRVIVGDEVALICGACRAAREMHTCGNCFLSIRPEVTLTS